MISFSRIINLLLTLAIAFLLYRLILAKATGYPNDLERDRLFAKLGIEGEPDPEQSRFGLLSMINSRKTTVSKKS